MHVFCSPLKLQSQHTIPGIEWVPRNILKEQEKEGEKERREKKRWEKNQTNILGQIISSALIKQDKGLGSPKEWKLEGD